MDNKNITVFFFILFRVTDPSSFAVVSANFRQGCCLLSKVICSAIMKKKKIKRSCRLVQDAHLPPIQKMWLSTCGFFTQAFEKSHHLVQKMVRMPAGQKIVQKQLQLNSLA